MFASCAGHHQRRTVRQRFPQCAELRSRAERAIPTLPAPPPALDLRFTAKELLHQNIHPHGGPRPCFIAGLVPERWAHDEPAPYEEPTRLIWTLPPSDGDRASLSYQFTPAAALEGMDRFMETDEIAPMRSRGQVLRETNGAFADGRERRRLLVTREAEGLRLLMVRWSADVREDGVSYFRCEVTLAGDYEAALPLFEAVCDVVRVRIWEYGW